MLFSKAFSLSAALLATTAIATTNISTIFYCPYDVKLASPANPTSLEFTYTPTNAPINPDMFEGKACLLEVWLWTTEDRGDAYFDEVEYKSNKDMSIETKLAFNGAWAPQIYDTVSVTTSEVAIARNTTFDSMAWCAQKPRPRREWLFFLQTKFSDAAIGSDFRLEQKINLRFSESTNCTVMPECDRLDIDRKFPPCHGVPGGNICDDCDWDKGL